MTIDRIESGGNGVVPTRPFAAAQLVLDARADLGEGPVWDDVRRVVWWVDIVGGRIHQFDPASGADDFLDLGMPVGCLALADDGALILAAPESVIALDPETGASRTLAGFEPASVPSRCNDGKCDPQGRFWIGRVALDLAAGAGSLSRFDGASIEVVRRDLTIPNGLDWSTDGSRMYFIDSSRPEVGVFDYDAGTGAMTGGRRFAALDGLGLPAGAVPDGMTVDSEDHLWVAMWGGGCVLRFAPDGHLAGRIDVPVSRVSNCAFGGADLTELFITTARDWESPNAVAEPGAGGLYRARPGVRGRPASRFRPTGYR